MNKPVIHVNQVQVFCLSEKGFNWGNERTDFTTNTTVFLPSQMFSYLKHLIFINFCVTFVKIREKQLPPKLKVP